MSRRLALIVATYEYDDQELGKLTAPRHDAEELADVLGNPSIGAFEVTTLINESRQTVGEKIGEFYNQARPNDLTLLYFSGHGLKDDSGKLYLAMKDTHLNNKRWTAVTADQVDESLGESASKQKIVILDCCYAGAFPFGTVTKSDDTVHAVEKLAGTGRFVLTASDATQFAFEGDRLRSGDAQPSIFTRHLIEGLRDGAADSDLDGDITVDELYEYVYQKVSEERPQQRPKKHASVSGETVIAQNINWSLPADLNNYLDAPYPNFRLQALQYLDTHFRKGNATVRSKIHQTVEALRDDDDSLTVRSAAGTWLKEHPINDSLLRGQPPRAGPGLHHKASPPEGDQPTGQVKAEPSDSGKAILRKPQPHTRSLGFSRPASGTGAGTHTPTSTIGRLDLLGHLWPSMLTSGVLSVILGLLLLIWPGPTLPVVGSLFGLYLLVTGVGLVYFAIAVQSGEPHIQLLVCGVASAVLALVTALMSLAAAGHLGGTFFDRGPSTAATLALLMVSGFVVRGFAYIAAGAPMHGLPARRWHTVFGVMMLIAGVVFLLASFGATDWYWVWLPPSHASHVLAITGGCLIFVISVCEIVASFPIRKAAGPAPSAT
ncbi:MAG: caspase family protein [Mycobacteriaceae bacterium]|nr:caspase family protein [Mycobacteriaceae bacterium]MBV9640704.1 caspase family protein [Mycobacteriaceae bacterium]